MCARIKYTALVDNIRGSIQGTTFQRNAYGYTVKGKPAMVNPNTNRQRSRKQTFSIAAQAWRTISDADRAAWEAYAETFPIPSRLNPDAYLNGFAAFTRWHGVAKLSNPFAVLADPAGAQGTILVDGLELKTDGVDLQYLDASIETEGPFNVQLFLSRPISATQRFVKSWTRFIVDEPVTPGIDIAITTQYLAIFGKLPAVGDLIGARQVFYNTTNGQIFFASPQIITVTAL
jgi:hypothetical protein